MWGKGLKNWFTIKMLPVKTLPLITPGRCQRILLQEKMSDVMMGNSPGGVLRYISDGGVQSPFLGLKFAIWGLFLGLKFCSDFFCVRDFGKDFLRFSFLCQTIVSVSFTKERWTQKLSEILLNYYYFVLIGLFLGYVLGCWTFFGPGSSLKDFFWV